MKLHDVKPRILSDRTKAPRRAKVVDAFTSSLEELFFIEHPQLNRHELATTRLLRRFVTNPGIAPIWVYYPWLQTVVRCMPEDYYFRLRTARNRNLITPAEQIRYRNAKVGVAGLSVGSAIVSALAVSGGPKVLKIADFDVIAPSNLNRIRAALPDVGTNKTVVAARAVWEIDPFAELHLWERGLDFKSLRQFIVGKPQLDVFIDEMDGLDVKVAARLFCKKHRIPVLMATDNGDGIILDIERFDQEPARPIFHGSLRNVRLHTLRHLDKREWLGLVIKIIGPRFMTPRHQTSLLEIGNTLAGVAQLGTAAFLAGAATSFAVRRIVNAQAMPSGRYLIGLEDVLIPGYRTVKTRQRRARSTRLFQERLLR